MPALSRCLLYLIVIGASTLSCSRSVQNPINALGVDPVDVVADISSQIDVTLDMRNASKRSYWIASGLGSPGRRGSPYISFYPQLRAKGDVPFLPLTLEHTHFLPGRAISEEEATDEGLIKLLGPESFLRFRLRIDVEGLLRDTLGSVTPGSYELRILCEPGFAHGEESFRYPKFPVRLESNIIRLIVR